MTNGKGDSPRPFSVNQETFATNWDRIFDKKDRMCEYSGLPNTSSYNEYVSSKESSQNTER